jgi:hypothetical protein
VSNSKLKTLKGVPAETPRFNKVISRLIYTFDASDRMNNSISTIIETGGEGKSLGRRCIPPRASQAG